MRAISRMQLIQIEVTNTCHLSCANCTRFIGHHRKSFMMSVEDIRRAIHSLKGYAGHIGLMGGEPTLHPQFPQICKIYQELIPEKERRELWTSGYKWDEYRDLIHDTFYEKYIAYNDHSNVQEGWHQPLLIAIEEVIENKNLMWKLIDNCWIQLRWSASITPKGAFFCEVAAAQDHLFNGPGGWPIEPGWWERTPEGHDFQEQVKRYCPKCSACLPMPMIPNNHEIQDFVSPGNAERLKQVHSPKFLQGRYRIVAINQYAEYLKGADGVPGAQRGSLQQYPHWTPWNYRSAVYHTPGEGTLSAKEVRALQTGKTSVSKKLSA